MARVETVQPEGFMRVVFYNTNKRKKMSELKTVREIMEYQKALLSAFEAREITAEHLRAATYAARELLKTMNNVAEAEDEHLLSAWGV